MNVQSMEAFNDGMRGLRAGLGDLRESKLRKEMAKRQIEQDKLAEDDRKFDRAMKTKQIELAQNADRRAGMAAVNADMDRGAAQSAKLIDDARRERESDARIGLLRAQTAATSAKPTSPVAAQLAGIDDFANNFASALDENQAALAGLQDPTLQADPAAMKGAQLRALKGQIRLSALQQMSEGWTKNAQKEPTVDLTFPGEDGVSSMKMRIPQSQWNESNPMWGKFMGGGTTPTAPAGGSPPAMPAEGAVVEQGGARYRRQNGQWVPMKQ
jgi:hypothetical protein